MERHQAGAAKPMSLLEPHPDPAEAVKDKIKLT
jgi:hypothetical protein